MSRSEEFVTGVDDRWNADRTMGQHLGLPREEDMPSLAHSRYQYGGREYRKRAAVEPDTRPLGSVVDRSQVAQRLSTDDKPRPTSFSLARRM